MKMTFIDDELFAMLGFTERILDSATPTITNWI
jgi:hypothetical protein